MSNINQDWQNITPLGCIKYLWIENGIKRFMIDWYLWIGKYPKEVIDAMHDDGDFDLTSVWSNSSTAHVRRARWVRVIDAAWNVDTSQLLPPNNWDTIYSWEQEWRNWTTWRDAARITSSARWTWDATQNPWRMIFWVTKNWARSTSTYLTLHENWNLILWSWAVWVALWSPVPASSTATWIKWQIAQDTNYIYVCTATNTRKRTALNTR